MAKLYFIYAAMNAGKSATLLQASFNYRERGMRTLLFTAAIDRRWGEGVVASRLGMKEAALVFDAATDMRAAVAVEHSAARIDCVFVDEAQFLTARQVDGLASVVDELSIPALCYGLRTDFRGDLFEGSERLLAIADEIRELKTICECGAKATMNLRIDRDGRAVLDGERVEIGGDDRYVALCRRHFNERRAAVLSG